MLRPRSLRTRSAAPLSLSGPTLLALHASHDAELNRLARAQAWQIDPGLSPSIMDRARDFGARLFGPADAPPALPESLASADAVYDRDVGYALASDVAVIAVEGVLAAKGYFDWWDGCRVAGYTDIADAVLTAQADERVAAILLCINSPGGIAYGVDDLAATLRQNSARTGQKPVAAFCTMAYSAAQYIASACDATYAPRGSGLGSIGVRMGWFDFSDMMKEDGVRREEFVSGKYKDSGSPFRPVEEDERAMFQADIDAHAGFFFDAVAQGRGLDAATVRGWEARTFTAGAPGDLDPEAAGLLDAVLTEREAFDAVRFMAGLEPLSLSSEETEPAATARAATERPARRMSSTTGGAKKEETMSLQSTIAALRAKAANGDTKAADELKAQGIALTASSPARRTGRPGASAEGGTPDPEEEEEDDPDAEGDDPDPDAEEEDPDAEGDEPDPDAEDDDQSDAEANASRVLNSSEAKGREALAGRLAVRVASGKLSARDAIADLKASPRGSRLDDRMAATRHGAKPGTGISQGKESPLVAAAREQAGR